MAVVVFAQSHNKRYHTDCLCFIQHSVGQVCDAIYDAVSNLVTIEFEGVFNDLASLGWGKTVLD